MRHRPLCAGLRLTVLSALRRLGLRECVACRFGSGSSHSNRRFPVMLSWGPAAPFGAATVPRHWISLGAQRSTLNYSSASMITRCDKPSIDSDQIGGDGPILAGGRRRKRPALRIEAIAVVHQPSSEFLAGRHREHAREDAHRCHQLLPLGDRERREAAAHMLLGARLDAAQDSAALRCEPHHRVTPVVLVDRMSTDLETVGRLTAW